MEIAHVTWNMQNQQNTLYRIQTKGLAIRNYKNFDYEAFRENLDLVQAYLSTKQKGFPLFGHVIPEDVHFKLGGLMYFFIGLAFST